MCAADLDVWRRSLQYERGTGVPRPFEQVVPPDCEMIVAVEASEAPNFPAPKTAA